MNEETRSGPGRPPTYTDDALIVLSPEAAETRLQQRSERRALVNHLIDCGGRERLGRINEWFGYDTRHIVGALQRKGWVRLLPHGSYDAEAMPPEEVD